MTTHELARLLLAGPDGPASVPCNGEALPVAAVWLGVPVSPTGDIEHVYNPRLSDRVILALPRVTLIADAGACPCCLLRDGHEQECPVTRAEVPHA